MTRKLTERTQATVRCAIYTRKSTEEGLEQEFNSLDAQREAAEVCIASQRHEGWHCLPDRYDDGGFTGGNTDRPALRRLLADVDAGRIDCVVVYKVDRLSRSLLDFTKLMESFDKHRVSFVSVTQQFNTASSMGRLVLNVLLSFAQFEREIIAERTRDKISAMRRKGKWAGGLPPLGYDVDPLTNRLAVNADEAAHVGAIFALYRQHGSLLPVVEALRDRGWTNKRTTTKKGTERGGRPFDRTSLHRLLINVIYNGQVAHKDEVFPGEHTAIIDPEVFAEVRARLRRNGSTGGAMVRNGSGALLKGFLRCEHCDCSMFPTYTAKGNKRYRYYVCSLGQKNGRATCPAKSVSPKLIVDQTAVGQSIFAMIRKALGKHSVYGLTVTAGNGASAAHGGTTLVPKLELVASMQILLQNRRLEIAPSLEHAPLLAQEPTQFQIRGVPLNAESILEWRERPHDDLVLAVAIATWQAERPSGVCVNVIQYADPTETPRWWRC